MLKELREARGLTQIELAEKIGVSERTIRKYEQEEDTIQVGVLKKILNNLDMSSNDINFLSNNQKEVSINDVVTQIQIPVYDEVSASAGFGRVNDEAVSFYASFDKAFLKSYFKLTSFTNLAFVRCEGDSMTPALPTNARLLVQHRTDFKEGQIVLARIDDELFVKRLQKQPSLKLLSTNPSYEPISLQGKDYELLAVVLGFLKCVE